MTRSKHWGSDVSALHLDWETRSCADLKKTGADRYARDLSTEIVCASFRFDELPVRRWRPGEPFPGDVLAHVWRMGKVVAHNAMFERVVWNHVLPRYIKNAPVMQPEQQIDTMARAYALALPPSLDGVGQALGLATQKDRDGHRLMMKLCKPRSVDPLAWWEDPADIARLQAYCDQDVEVETLVDKTLPPLSPSEQRLWVLDQTINDRGVQIDIPMVTRALSVVEVAMKQADRKMWEITDGAVKRITETGKLVAWLNSRGIECESVAKGETDELVAAATLYDDQVALGAVELRKSAKSSTAKFKAMLSAAAEDFRVRGSLQYHGAATGRWAGRLIQPQNFPRVDAERDLWRVEAALALLDSELAPQDVAESLRLYTNSEPMDVLSKCLRAMIIAAPGKDLIGGDFAQIENRIAAWIAGEEWKLNAFRAYDTILGHDSSGKEIRKGPDLYVMAYSEAFGVPPEAVDKTMRAGGKVQELACQFGGAENAVLKMAHNLGMPLSEDRAKQLKVGFRDANPNIVQSWWDLGDAAIEAVRAPGMAVPCLRGRIQYVVSNGFLFCRLPSLRVIAYAAPRLVAVEDKFGRTRYQVEFDGVDSLTKRWCAQRLYGGLQFENIVQAAARDVMVSAMFRSEAANYPLVCTIHDEILSEIPEGFGSLEEFTKMMSETVSWAPDMPVAVSTWRDRKYVK